MASFCLVLSIADDCCTCILADTLLSIRGPERNRCSKSTLVEEFLVPMPEPMRTLSGDDMILSYNDVVLRGSDLEILNGTDYINDRIIEFYFSYLSSTYSSKDILLVPPSISFWIANCLDAESVNDVVGPLDLPSRKIAIFTVNDNLDMNMAGGGMHWSLLVYVKEDDIFIHHDSLSLNHSVAEKFYKSIKRYLKIFGLASNACFVEGPTPPQRNSYDCGLYVMAVAKVICQWYTSEPKGEGRWFSAIKDRVTSSSIDRMRTDILAHIKDLMEEKK